MFSSCILWVDGENGIERLRRAGERNGAALPRGSALNQFKSLIIRQL
ncbi:MAG: hypothetical protein J6Y80_07100 [Victivallales bacterium]|nr:hypothetical protein [Victivallales bacterium]